MCLDAEGIVSLLDDLVNLARAEILFEVSWDDCGGRRAGVPVAAGLAIAIDFAAVGTLLLEKEGLEMSADRDEGVDGWDVAGGLFHGGPGALWCRCRI